MGSQLSALTVVT